MKEHYYSAGSEAFESNATTGPHKSHPFIEGRSDFGTSVHILLSTLINAKTPKRISEKMYCTGPVM